MRRIGLAGAAVVIGIVLGGVGAAGADAVLLQKGGLLSGELQVSELIVATAGGEVRLGAREVQTVTLGSIAGDTVTFRNGRTLTGRVEHAEYTMRLPSGQAIVVARGGLDQLHFSPRR